VSPCPQGLQTDIRYFFSAIKEENNLSYAPAPEPQADTNADTALKANLEGFAPSPP